MTDHKFSQCARYQIELIKRDVVVLSARGDLGFCHNALKVFNCEYKEAWSLQVPSREFLMTMSPGTKLSCIGKDASFEVKILDEVL